MARGYFRVSDRACLHCGFRGNQRVIILFKI